MKDINGREPYNSYLWPTESWWISHEKEFRTVAGDYHIAIIALENGTFATSGHAWDIEASKTDDGRPCVFKTRTGAIRSSASALIRRVRYIYRNEHPHWRISRENAERIIHRARQIVAIETDKTEPIAITIPPPPDPPDTIFDDLPLFQITKNR